MHAVRPAEFHPTHLWMAPTYPHQNPMIMLLYPSLLELLNQKKKKKNVST